MKTRRVLLLLLLTAVLLPVSAQQMLVGTYNIRNKNDGDSLRPARLQIEPHSPRVRTPTTHTPSGKSLQMLYASWRVPTSSRSGSVWMWPDG